jgi:hypothetical protein
MASSMVTVCIRGWPPIIAVGTGCPVSKTIGGAWFLMVVELSHCVGQHRVIIETIFGELEVLPPFHGKD